MEYYKSLVTSRCWLFLLILLLWKTGSTTVLYREIKPDLLYKAYMTTLAGEISEEKERYLVEERNRINQILAQKDMVQQAYLNGEMTREAYKTYFQAYFDASERTESLKKVEQHMEYLRSIREKGQDGWFVYDEGWNRLFYSEFDVTLFMAVLLTTSASFSMEYTNRQGTSGFHPILRQTKHGRGKTFRCKLAVSLTVAALLFLLWSAVDWIGVLSVYPLPYPEAPVVSLLYGEKMPMHTTIAASLAGIFLIRLIAVSLIACVGTMLAVILEKQMPVIAALLSVVLLPAVLTNMGIPFMVDLDYTAVWRAVLMLTERKFALPFIFVLLMMLFLWRGEVKWNGRRIQ